MDAPWRERGEALDIARRTGRGVPYKPNTHAAVEAFRLLDFDTCRRSRNAEQLAERPGRAALLLVH
jgi:hypothetical protein